MDPAWRLTVQQPARTVMRHGALQGTLTVFSQLGVDPRLSILVFGESILNDAVSIVFFQTVRRAVARRAEPCVGAGHGRRSGSPLAGGRTRACSSINSPNRAAFRSPSLDRA